MDNTEIYYNDNSIEAMQQSQCEYDYEVFYGLTDVQDAPKLELETEDEHK